jgi:hypothetical protein
MARNYVPCLRFLLAAALWGAAVGSAQGALGGPIARAAHDVEERIELRVRGVAPEPEPQPARSHDSEVIEPWELVGV